MNFRDAFDKVLKNKLLPNLRNLGMGLSPLQWIKNFLLARRQKERINFKYSPRKPALSRVPKGCLLDPILFILYVNEISNTVASPLLPYADNVKL